MPKGRRKGYRSNPNEQVRKCLTCGEVKSLTTAYFYAADNWFRQECIACTGIRNACKTYGISPELYLAIVERQGGGCANCGEMDYGKRSGHTLSIDHDHVTGAIRGLLCSRCNLAIGYLRDRPELCRRAEEYLHETRQVDLRQLQPEHRAGDAPRPSGPVQLPGVA